MKKEFSADLIARQRLLMEREQAQNIEKNIFTTNQTTGLKRGNPFTQSGKARMDANKAGKKFNQMDPHQQQAFKQQMQSQNIAMDPQGKNMLSARSGQGTKHGFAGSLANSMMNVHNTQARENMQTQFAGMGGNPANAPTGNTTGANAALPSQSVPQIPQNNTGSTGSTGSTGNTGSTGSTNNVGTQSPPSGNTGGNSPNTPSNNVTTVPQRNQNPPGGNPPNQQLPNQTPPRIQNPPQGGGGGNPPNPPQGGGGGNPPNPPQGGQAPQGQAPQGQAPQGQQQGGNNQMQQMAQNYGAAQDMNTLQGGRQGKESWLRNADGSMKGVGQLAGSVAGGVLTGGLSNLAGAGMRALKNRGVKQQNQQFDQASNRMNMRAMGGNPMMQYKASQESADRIYSSIEHIGIRKSISKNDEVDWSKPLGDELDPPYDYDAHNRKTMPDVKDILDLTEDDVSEEEMHNKMIIESIYGMPYDEAIEMIIEEQRRQAEMTVGGATAPNPMIPDYIKDKEAKDSTKARVRDMVEDSKSEEKGE